MFSHLLMLSCVWVCKHMSYGANLCSHIPVIINIWNVILANMQQRSLINGCHMEIPFVTPFTPASWYDCVRLTFARCWKNGVTKIPILQCSPIWKAVFPTKKHKQHRRKKKHSKNNYDKCTLNLDWTGRKKNTSNQTIRHKN